MMQRKAVFNLTLLSLSTLSFVFGILLLSDRGHDVDAQPSARAPLLVAIVFFVVVAMDGLMVLSSWRMIELAPKTLSGLILGFIFTLTPAGDDTNEITTTVLLIHSF